jgi:phosphoglycerate dehydrogenase-like enzyme
MKALLVLAPDADEYLPGLENMRASGLPVSIAANVAEAGELGREFSIILGQPDLVALFLSSGRTVDWVQSTWAGVAPLIDLGRRDYLLTGVKDVFGPQIAEYVLGYLLAHELRLLERLGRQANRDWWAEPNGTLDGKTLGLLGTGSIGRHLAAVFGHLGVRVLGLNRSGEPVAGFETMYPRGQLLEFLARSDYLVCTLPQTAETDRLMDRDAFAALRRGCYLVNVGRGSVIDEEALLEALSGGRLAGAALDVFRDEPLPEYSPLWHAPDTLVTAHVAAKTRPGEILAIFTDNYGRFLHGEELKHRIDFDRGY